MPIIDPPVFKINHTKQVRPFLSSPWFCKPQMQARINCLLFSLLSSRRLSKRSFKSRLQSLINFVFCTTKPRITMRASRTSESRLSRMNLTIRSNYMSLNNNSLKNSCLRKKLYLDLMLGISKNFPRSSISL